MDPDLVAEPAGDRTLKGFSRAIPTYVIERTRAGSTGDGVTAEGAAT